MQVRRALRKLRTLYKHSPTFLLAAWFGIILIVGTLLLILPVSHNPDGPSVGFLAALFTAVSAFCVTGLTLVDTHDAFSTFGHVVIMLLIELGGVGIMTFASLAYSMVGRRMSMAGKAALADTLFQNDASLEFRIVFASLLKAVILVQLAGVVVLYVALKTCGEGPNPPNTLWSALFHSVSAFCNAGFSIYRDNLVPVAGNRPFLFTIAALVVLGGLGHAVLAELYLLPGLIGGLRKKPHWLSFNSRIILLVTGGLLLLGAAAVAVSNILFADARHGGIFDSIFHSVIARTAGFNSAPLDGIPLSTCLFLCLLMFVGGSPGSCAGGVKTTSLAIWLARIAANLRHDLSVSLMGRTIPMDLVGKARLIMALTTLWTVLGVIVLSFCHPEAGMDTLLFEQISALATVGLTMGFTPKLNAAAQIWIILSMIMGKFGPLTIALWMVPPTKGSVTGPEGRLMIG